MAHSIFESVKFQVCTHYSAADTKMTSVLAQMLTPFFLVYQNIIHLYDAITPLVTHTLGSGLSDSPIR